MLLQAAHAAREMRGCSREPGSPLRVDKEMGIECGEERLSRQWESGTRSILIQTPCTRDKTLIVKTTRLETAVVVISPRACCDARISSGRTS